MTEKAEVPPGLQTSRVDEAFGGKTPLFERASATATVTIFKGGHEIIQPAAIAWMEKLYAQRLEIR